MSATLYSTQQSSQPWSSGTLNTTGSKKSNQPQFKMNGELTLSSSSSTASGSSSSRGGSPTDSSGSPNSGTMMHGNANTVGQFQPRSQNKPIPNQTQLRYKTNQAAFSTGSQFSDHGYASASPADCFRKGQHQQQNIPSLANDDQFNLVKNDFKPKSSKQQQMVQNNEMRQEPPQLIPDEELPASSAMVGSSMIGSNLNAIAPVFQPAAQYHQHNAMTNGFSPPFSPEHHQHHQNRSASFFLNRGQQPLESVKESVMISQFSNNQLFNSAAFGHLNQDFSQMNMQESQQPDAFGSNRNKKNFGEIIGPDGKRIGNTTFMITQELRMLRDRDVDRQLDGSSFVAVPGHKQQHGQRTKMVALNGRGQPKQTTAFKLVNLRYTQFSQRFSFDSFIKVLPRQKVNPYHIKMEGEGYGSDDLRNFILSQLSMASCNMMNCVTCGVELPVYDHFPLVDGTMFLSPERNPSQTKRAVKISSEGKCEFVHACCVACLEGMNTITCTYCSKYWQGSHLTLGTLYMYDIFAASPCCNNRLTCKNCNVAIHDVMYTRKMNFSDFSRKNPCPSCGAVDHHFVRPANTFKVRGLVHDQNA